MKLSKSQETCRTCSNSKLNWKYPSDRSRKCTLGYTCRQNGYCKFYEKTNKRTFVDFINSRCDILGKDSDFIIENFHPEQLFYIPDSNVFAYQWESEMPDGVSDLTIQLYHTRRLKDDSI